MRRGRMLVIAVLTGGLILGLFGSAQRITQPKPRSTEAAVAAALGAKRVKAAYEQWVVGHETNGGDRNVIVALGYTKGLSSAFTRARGTARLNLLEGTVSVSVEGLPTNERWSVWLVDNRPERGNSVKPEADDRVLAIGELGPVRKQLVVEADLGPRAFEEFLVDQIVVARTAAGPEQGVLFGAPPLFQRLHMALRSNRLLAVSDFRERPGIALARGGGLIFGVAPATAQVQPTAIDLDVLFSTLVATGANLFINETFAGNGRTCATCHPALNNFTIDVAFIDSLPDSDPLFVAEFLPALAFDPTGAGRKFEVPVLMRGAALIVENQDGFDDLTNKFNMRSVPHALALRTSLAPAPDGTTTPPNERTGWSGDGAPGNGTLRDFATGAVTQHFTKTLARVAGSDFRLPTDAELDAMEAFQRALGRESDLSLPLTLKGAQAARGQAIFTSTAARCNTCHSNAGANASFFSGTNGNFNTGVENQPDRPAQVILSRLGLDLTPGVAGNLFPRDGGFGQVGNSIRGFGDGTFNTPPLVEAADTPPFFHDNSLDTIEGAVSFYNSDSFNNSPSGAAGRINLSATQVELIAAFLRVINAIENIREATEAALAAKNLNSKPTADALLGRAIAEANDAIEVLLPRGLHLTAITELEAALVSLEDAVNKGSGARNQRIDAAVLRLNAARADMI